MGDDLRASQQRLEPLVQPAGRAAAVQDRLEQAAALLCRDLIRRHARIGERLARLARIQCELRQLQLQHPGFGEASIGDAECAGQQVQEGE